jgi:hypothetical protein
VLVRKRLVLLEDLNAQRVVLPKQLTQINRIVAVALVAQMLRTLQRHRRLLAVVVKLMPNLVLVLPQHNAHAVIFAHLKNDAWNEKLIILVQHELMQALHLLLQQDLVLLHRVVLLMRVVVNQPIIVILLLAKTKADQRVSQLRYPQHAKQPLLVNQLLHLLAKQHLLVPKVR